MELKKEISLKPWQVFMVFAAGFAAGLITLFAGQYALSIMSGSAEKEKEVEVTYEQAVAWRDDITKRLNRNNHIREDVGRGMEQAKRRVQIIRSQGEPENSPRCLQLNKEYDRYKTALEPLDQEIAELNVIADKINFKLRDMDLSQELKGVVLDSDTVSRIKAVLSADDFIERIKKDPGIIPESAWAEGEKPPAN